MALDLIRESIDIEQVMAQGAAQALVEGSVLVPGNGREEIRLLFADGEILLGNTEVQADRVALEGTVLFHVLYAQGEEGRLRSLEAATPFHHTLEAQGAGPRMQARVSGALDSVEAEYGSGRISLRAVASISAQCTVESQIMCVTDIEGIDDLQLLKQEVVSLSTAGEGDSRSPLSAEIELPQALEPVEALYTHVTISPESVTADDNYVTLRGEAVADVWLLSDLPERPLIRQRQAIPYEVDVPVQGCTPDLQTITGVTARDARSDLVFDQEGTPLLRVDMNLLARATALETQRVEAVQDAYSASDAGIKLQTETITARTRAESYSCTDTVKTSLSLPSGTPPLGSILAVAARPASAQPSGGDNRTTYEGVLDMTVVYIPAGGTAPVSYREEVPYRVIFDASTADDSWAMLTVEDSDAIPITSDRLEFKCTLRLSGVHYENEEYTVALDAEEYELPQPKCGVVLVFTREGDTLWDIAKRYRVSVDTITRFNPEVADPLSAGEKLLLYTRRSNNYK